MLLIMQNHQFLCVLRILFYLRLFSDMSFSSFYDIILQYQLVSRRACLGK